MKATALLNALFIYSAPFEIQNPWQCILADLGDVGVSESCLFGINLIIVTIGTFSMGDYAIFVGQGQVQNIFLELCISQLSVSIKLHVEKFYVILVNQMLRVHECSLLKVFTHWQCIPEDWPRWCLPIWKFFIM